MKEYNIGDLVLLTLDSPGEAGITEGLADYKERKFRISKVKTIIPKNKSAGSRATYYELKLRVRSGHTVCDNRRLDPAYEGAKKMKPNEEECAVCHKVMNRYWMEHIGTGRNSHWICPECYKNGHKQVDCVAYRPGRPARREAENK